MRVVAFAILLILPAGLVGAQTAAPAPRVALTPPIGGQIAITGNRTQRVIDCHGGELAVIGNGNSVSATNCRRIAVPGNHNRVTARFAAAGEVSVAGNDNVIVWSALSGVKVVVSVVGSRDQIAHG